jgi:hypothetical protein
VAMMMLGAAKVSPLEASIVSGLVNVSRYVGGAIGLAVLTILHGHHDAGASALVGFIAALTAVLVAFGRQR